MRNRIIKCQDDRCQNLNASTRLFKMQKQYFNNVIFQNDKVSTRKITNVS